MIDCLFGEGTRVNTSFLLSSLALDDVITGDGVCVDIMCGLHGAGFGFVVWETVRSYVSEQAE